MSEPKNTQTEPTLPAVESVDVRAELKKNVVEEFVTALSEQAALTDCQRKKLAELVNDETASATSILQTLSIPEDQQ